MSLIEEVNKLSMEEVVGEKGLLLAGQLMRQANKLPTFWLEEAAEWGSRLASEEDAVKRDTLSKGIVLMSRMAGRVKTTRGVRSGKQHPHMLKETSEWARADNWAEADEKALNVDLTNQRKKAEKVDARRAKRSTASSAKGAKAAAPKGEEVAPELKKTPKEGKSQGKPAQNGAAGKNGPRVVWIRGVSCKADAKRDCGYIASPFFATVKGFKTQPGVVQNCNTCGGWRVKPCCPKNCEFKVLKTEPRSLTSGCGALRYVVSNDVKLLPTDIVKSDVSCVCDGAKWLSRAQRRRNRVTSGKSSVAGSKAVSKAASVSDLVVVPADGGILAKAVEAALVAGPRVDGDALDCKTTSSKSRRKHKPGAGAVARRKEKHLQKYAAAMLTGVRKHGGSPVNGPQEVSVAPRKPKSEWAKRSSSPVVDSVEAEERAAAIAVCLGEEEEDAEGDALLRQRLSKAFDAEMANLRKAQKEEEVRALRTEAWVSGVQNRESESCAPLVDVEPAGGRGPSAFECDADECDSSRKSNSTFEAEEGDSEFYEHLKD